MDRGRRDIYSDTMCEVEKVLKDHAKKAPLIFSSVDIDGFWSLGDEHSRLNALTSLKNLLVSTFPQSRIWQIGNDRFGVLITNVALFPLELVFRALDQARDAFTSSTGATFCAGIAAYPKDTTEAPELVALSGEALYKAKKQGKNQVLLAPGERMKLKSSHYRIGQLDRLARLAQRLGRSEAALLREALEYFLQSHGEG